MADALRYKARFRSRQGRNIGFAPEICLPDSDEIPYCYDPPAIEDLRRRADCVLHIQERHYDALVAQIEAMDSVRQYFNPNPTLL